MNAEIIAVGSELLTPHRMDTNSLFLTDRLSRLGIRVSRKTIVGDSSEELGEAFDRALEHADIIISSGGLGPTADDITRESLAALLGRPLRLDEAVLEGIRQRFRRFGRTMPEVNVRQAMVPEGAEVLSNPRGTAPGLWLETSGRIVILLPGPPDELQALFDREVHPRLAERAPSRRLFSRDVRVVNLPESTVEERISPIYKEYPAVEITILAARGEIQVHPYLWSDNPEAAAVELDEIVRKLEHALGDHIFSTAGESIEKVVAGLLIGRHATIAAAESCTGGLVAERLTTVPGSSAYFLGGIVCYTNAAKRDWVGVAPELIEQHGAVSSPVAIALAEGIRRQAGASLGLGITGIAGPSGGTPEKPVGTVHIALGESTHVWEAVFHFPGDRERVRLLASQMALDWVRRTLLHGAPVRR